MCSLSMSLLIWKLPVDVSNFRVLISILCSSFVQLIIPNVGMITGIANILWDAALLLACSSDDQIFLSLSQAIWLLVLYLESH